MSLGSAIVSSVFEVVLSILIVYGFYFFGFKKLNSYLKERLKSTLALRAAQMVAIIFVFSCFALFVLTLNSVTGMELFQ